MTQEHRLHSRRPWRDFTNDALGNLSFGHRKVTSNVLHMLEIRRRKRVVKSVPKIRHAKVTPFVLEGRWTLDRLDQATMRWLSKVMKRKRLGVADVIYEVIESFVAKCEAQAEVETKIIKFPSDDGVPIRVRQIQRRF